MSSLTPHYSFSEATSPSTTASCVLSALSAYDLRAQAESGHYRCNSPLRPGSNSHGFSLTLDVDGEHGAYFDHVSEQSGTLYDLARHLGVALPDTRQEVETTKRAYRDLADYAQAHGVEAAVFEAALWHETTYQDRPVLAFPTQSGTRYRFLDGEKPTYKSQYGYQACWYGLSKAIERANASGQPLILCNGEASVLVALYFGLAACCMTAGEKSHMSDDLLAALKAYTGPILIALDCDEKGRACARSLLAQLQAEGFQARAVDLHLGKGGDLADLCRLHGENVLTALQRLADLPPASTDIQQPTEKTEKPDLLDAAHAWAATQGQEWAYDADVDTWRRWTDTHWQAQTKRGPLDLQAAETLRSLAIAVSSASKLDGVTRLAEALCSRDFSHTASSLVNFQNGTLDLTTLQLRAHDRADNLTTCLPYPYAPGEYTAIQAALAGIVPDETARAAFMTHIGLSLMGDTSFHKALLLYGPKRSGKSTLLDLALLTCGSQRGQYADKWLFDGGTDGLWARMRYHEAALVGIDELPDSALQGEGEDNFKKMTAHGGVSMRAMRAMQTTANRWQSKLLMTTNDAPRYRDSSGALTERLLLIRCPNSRTDAQQDRTLFEDKLRAEVPAFAAACLDLALSALKSGLYPESEAMRRLRDQIENQGDSVKTWVADKAVFEPGVFTATDSLYGDYKLWCADNGQTPMSKPRFSQALTDRYTQLGAARKRQYVAPDILQQVRGILGLRLRLPGEDEADDCVTHVTHCDASIPSCVTPHEAPGNAKSQGLCDAMTQESKVGSIKEKEIENSAVPKWAESAKDASHASQLGQESAPADAKAPVTHEKTDASQPTLNGAEYEALRMAGERTKAAPGEYVHLFVGSSPLDQAARNLLPTLKDNGYLERQPGTERYRLSSAGWAALNLRVVHIDLSQF